LILVVAAYPFVDVAFGSATFHSSFAGSKYVTQGDVLIVVAQMWVLTPLTMSTIPLFIGLTFL
jgi:hypothetical protein